MCTAISYSADTHYFGRNLDLDRDYGQQVTIVPRNFPLCGRARHEAIIGMATLSHGYPLFFEGTNESGLSVAALNFPGNAVYHKAAEGKENIASYDFIPYVLTRCQSCEDAKALLYRAVVCDRAFSEDLPVTPLHWLIADKAQSLVAESTADGLQLYDNPIGALTNNPPFPFHRDHFALHMALSRDEAENRIAPSLPLKPISLGLGAMGLPGDYSSPSRFLRAATLRRWWAERGMTCTEEAGGGGDFPLSQFFTVLGAVSPTAGAVMTPAGGCHRTLYTCCMDTGRGVYHYRTEGEAIVRSVSFCGPDLNGESLWTVGSQA